MSTTNNDTGQGPEALDPSELQLARNAPGGITRVMSPRQNEGLLIGLAGTCHRCGDPVHEPIMCTQCGAFGHTVCLGIERFQGYPFCSGCLSGVIRQFAEFQDAVKREQWTRSLHEQITSWRQRAITAMGVSTAVGVTLGGIAATTTGAALAMVKGVVHGATATPVQLQSGVNLSIAANTPALEDVRQPQSSTVTSTTRARANSLDAPRIKDREICLACHTANRGHKPHIYRGDCVGFPGGAYYGARRTTPLAEELAVPDSFNSARSSGGQELITSAQTGMQIVVAEDSAVPEVQVQVTQVNTNFTPLESVSTPPAGFPSHDELRGEVKRLTGAVEELTRAVSDLQGSAVLTAQRLDALENDWEYEADDWGDDIGQADELTEHYYISDTPRDVVEQQANQQDHQLERWLGGQGSTEAPGGAVVPLQPEHRQLISPGQQIDYQQRAFLQQQAQLLSHTMTTPEGRFHLQDGYGGASIPQREANLGAQRSTSLFPTFDGSEQTLA